MALNIPDHLASIGYQEPRNAEDTAYIGMITNPERLPFFARCRWCPQYQEDFVAAMSNITNWKQNWTEYFDTAHLVDDNVVKKGRKIPIFVDVGGNSGVDVMRFLKKHPDCPAGSLILQDVPDVVAMASTFTVPISLLEPSPPLPGGSFLFFFFSFILGVQSLCFGSLERYVF